MRFPTPLSCAFCVFAIPAAACDITQTILDTYEAQPEERNAALIACIAAGGDVTDAPDGFSPLDLLVSHENVDGVRIILDAGASPNQPDFDGMSATSLAAMIKTPGSRSEILRILVAAGGDLNVIDSTEFSPLSFAVFNGTDAAFISELIALGANPAMRGKNEETVLQFSVLGNCDAAIGHVLLDAGARLDDMPTRVIENTILHAERNCTHSEESREYLARLLRTATP